MSDENRMVYATDDMEHVAALFANYYPDKSHIDGELVIWGLMTDSNSHQRIEFVLRTPQHPGFIRITTALSDLVVSHLHVRDPARARISYPGFIELFV